MRRMCVIMNRPKKELEDMTLEELKLEMAKVNRKVGFKPRKSIVRNGAFILNPNIPADREWLEDDYY